MTQIINIETSKYGLAELLAMVRSGDEVIVQEGNMPPVRLSLAASQQVNAAKRHGPGLFAGKISMRGDFDEELPMSFWLGDDK